MRIHDEQFDSVFESNQIAHSTPTPIATPDLGSSDTAQSFRGLASPVTFQTGGFTFAQVLARQNRDWSTATRFLTKLLGSSRYAGFNEKLFSSPAPRDVKDAIGRLFIPDEGSLHQSGYDLITWFTRETLANLYVELEPLILQQHISKDLQPHIHRVMRNLVDVLLKYRRFYRESMMNHLLPAADIAQRLTTGRQDGHENDRPITDEQKTRLLSKFEDGLRQLLISEHTFVHVYNMLRMIVFETATSIFQFNKSSSPTDLELEDLQDVMNRLLTLLRDLESLGFGVYLTNSVIHATFELLDYFVATPWMNVNWHGSTSVVPKLRTWVSEGLVPFVSQLLKCLGFEPLDRETTFALLNCGMDALAKERHTKLFDFIVHWPHCLGAFRDLKECTTTIPARTQLILSFDKQLRKRLLHAGATTTDILNVFVFTIRAFAEIDPRGALISRATKPIHLYLKSRPDTAEIIVSSMLAEATDTDEVERDQIAQASNGNNKLRLVENTSVEIAKEMQRPITAIDQRDAELNWEDQDWMPDPIDAGPEFQRTKVEDIFGHLFKLFDRDAFIDVLKSILGEHLLHSLSPSDFAREIKVLELFKHRLGEDKLQACEVMLHDVETSRRTNLSIHQSEVYKANMDPEKDAPDANARILSSVFWPSLTELHIKLPPQLKEIQERYERGFESLKGGTQSSSVGGELEWIDALGIAEVELEFNDRVVCETVPLLFASVIYSFDEDTNGGRNNATDIAKELEVDVEEVSKAINFWVTKKVLLPVPNERGAFQVIEDLYAEVLAIILLTFPRLSNKWTSTKSRSWQKPRLQVQRRILCSPVLTRNSTRTISCRCSRRTAGSMLLGFQ